jgi:hypothetical protein
MPIRDVCCLVANGKKRTPGRNGQSVGIAPTQLQRDQRRPTVARAHRRQSGQTHSGLSTSGLRDTAIRRDSADAFRTSCNCFDQCRCSMQTVWIGSALRCARFCQQICPATSSRRLSPAVVRTSCRLTWPISSRSVVLGRLAAHCRLADI